MDRKLSRCAEASSQTEVMRMAESASAQRPQKIHFARSRVAARAPSTSLNEIASVGQTPAAGRTSFQLAKSISGRPRAWLETSGGVVGYRVVTTPVRRDLRRMWNMGWVEALKG